MKNENFYTHDVQYTHKTINFNFHIFALEKKVKIYL